jgi:hypothetical protein
VGKTLEAIGGNKFHDAIVGGYTPEDHALGVPDTCVDPRGKKESSDKYKHEIDSIHSTGFLLKSRVKVECPSFDED